MSDETKEEIVAELKRRFPEPHFRSHRVRDVKRTLWAAVTLPNVISPTIHVCGAMNEKDLLTTLKRIPQPPAAPAEAEDRYTKLRDACTRAGFGIMETSGQWSLHDVSPRAKELDQKTLDIINENCDLTARLTELEAITEELAEAGERAIQLRPHRMPEALAKLAAYKEKAK